MSEDIIQENLNKANEYIQQKDYSSAIEILQKIIKKDSFNCEAYKNLGLCSLNIEDYDTAFKMFEKAVEIKPDDALSMFYIGSIYHLIGNPEKAIEKFLSLIELRPDYYDAYKNIAVSYMQT
ncbi:MAG: tetratricopeptide repeat protein [Candidatus Gastranaerophilales bacterium]|nr:tetratricopeptide repeat protein [Candidatus Gastranaerophilales bacterium]